MITKTCLKWLIYTRLRKYTRVHTCLHMGKHTRMHTHTHALTATFPTSVHTHATYTRHTHIYRHNYHIYIHAHMHTHLYTHTASAVLNREDGIFFMPLFPGKHLCFSVKKTTAEKPLKTKCRENYFCHAYSSVCLDSCSLVNPAGALSGGRWPRGWLGTCPHLPTIAGGPPSNVQTHLWLRHRVILSADLTFVPKL